MKKTLAIIFSALICLSTPSCRSRKDNSSEKEPSVIETTAADETVTSVSSSSSEAAGSTAATAAKTTVSGSIAAVPEQGTGSGEQIKLSSADFNAVNVVLMKSDDPPEHKLHTLDTAKLDFGKSMSPCKAADVRDKYTPSMEELFGIDPEGSDIDSRTMEQFSKTYNYYLEYIKKNIDVPSKGNITSYTVHGDLVFMYVNYDDLCGTHDYSVFEYNTVSEKLREITHYSGLDNDAASRAAASNMYFYNGMLLLECIDIQTHKIIINSMDPDTGSIKEFPSDGNKMIWYADEDTLMLYEMTFIDDNTAPYSSIMPTILYRYKNGTFEEMDRSSTMQQSMLYGDELIKLSNEDQRSEPLVIETADYILDTGIENALFLCASKDHAVVYVSTGSWAIPVYDIYVFDLAKRECSVIKLEDIQMIVGSSGNDVIYDDEDGTHLLDTAIGTSFRIFSEGNAMLNEESDIKTITHYVAASPGSNTIDREREPLYWLEK